MTVGVETEKVSEHLNGHGGAEKEMPSGDDLVHEDPQGFAGAAAKIMKKTAIIVATLIAGTVAEIIGASMTLVCFGLL